MNFLLIVPVIFISAVLSGAFSMGGGILALAAFSLVIDPMSLIPVHGMVQLSSNLSRTILSWRNVRLKPVMLFAFGTAAGALAGRLFLVNLSPRMTAVLFSCGILFFTWMPPRKSSRKMKGNYIIAGSLAGYFSLILGVTGPLVAPFYLHDNYSKEGLVATKAASQIFTHACKIGVFASLGGVNGTMITTALVFIPFIVGGNWLGQKLMGRLPDHVFMLIIKVIITLLAVRMLLNVF